MATKRHTARVVAALTALLLSVASAHGGETPPLTNADIVDFVQANISPYLVIDKIGSSRADFDLSPEGVAALRRAGVSDEILSAMTAAGGGFGSSLAPLPGIGVPARSAPSPLPSLEPPPSLGEIPPSPFSGSSSPFAALDPLPSMPPPPSMPAQPATAPNVPSLPALPAQSAAPAPDAAFSSPLAPPPAASPMPPPPAFSSPLAAPAAAPQPSTPASGLDPNRFRSELANISSGSPEARRAALAWLIANQQNSLQPLREALREQRPELQAAAVYALGTMHDPESLAEIRRLISSPSRLVRNNAAEVLADDAPAIAAAEQALTSPSDPLDGHIRLVGHARLVRTARNLASILSGDRSAENRAAAAWSLAEIGRAGSLAWPALENALQNDDDAAVRREAARAVGVFHDPSSAKLLESACRRDPDVRKVTLQAMADYPETAEFLVGVMNLGADQIAADELEAARGSLFKLTGQDFGMDGDRWSGWLADNRSRFAAAPAAPVVATGPSLPPPPAPSTALSAAPSGAGSGGQVDVKAWGIVTDPAEIPMAPEVDATPNLRRAGIAGGMGSGSPGVLPPPPSGDIVEGPMAPRGGFGAPVDTGSLFGGFGGSGADAQATTPSYGSAWSGGGSITAPPSPAPFESAGSADSLRLPPPPGMAGAGGDAPLYSAPSFAPPPAATEYAAPPLYGGDPYGASGGSPYAASPAYGGYSGDYSGGVIVPSPAGVYGAPVSSAPQVDVMSGTSYGSSATYSDEVHSQPYTATGDLVPQAANTVPQYTGQPEPSLLGALADAPPTITTVEPDDHETLSFPGDTDSFGLGDPYFDESDPYASSGSGPSLFQGMTMPPPPGGGAADEADGEYDEWDDEGQPGDKYDLAAPSDSYADDSFEYDFDDPESPYSSVEADDYADSQWSDDDMEVEDLSSIPGFGAAVQGRASEDAPAPAAPSASSSESSMTVTTERGRRRSGASPAAPVAVPAPAPVPAPAAPQPRARAEIPPDASERASKILSALAEIEDGAGTAGSVPPPVLPAPVISTPLPRESDDGTGDAQYYDEDAYLTDDEVFDVDEAYPGGFIPSAPVDSAPPPPVGTPRELPLLGSDLSPLPVPSDIGTHAADDEAPAPRSRRRPAR